MSFGYTDDGQAGWKAEGADTVIPFKTMSGIKVATTKEISGVSAYNSSGSVTVKVSSYYDNYASLTSDWFAYISKIAAQLNSYKYGGDADGQGGDRSNISFTVSYKPSTGVLTINWSSIKYSGYDTTKTWSADIPIIVPT